jgi:putative sterol carrier protein
MGFYSSSDVLCGVLTDLFDRTLKTAAADKMLRDNKMVVRLETSEPSLVVTIDGKAEPPVFSCGDAGKDTDLALRMRADLLHDIWLDRVRLRDAFFSGQIELDGSMLKALNLAELFRTVESIYPEVLKERGLL